MPQNRTYLTNNHSILSKYSAVRAGYFQDDYLKLFIEDGLEIKRGWRRTPIVNRGYAARLLAIDWIVERTLRTEAIDCVIVLGSGYDTLAFRHLDKGCSWIELDLPQVVETKAKFICDFDVIKPKLTKDDDTNSSHEYHIISQDMKDTVELRNNLLKVLAKVATKRNVLILNEVCLCYLEIQEVEQILKTVISTLSQQPETWRIHYVGYEQLKPKESNSQMVNIMQNHFNSLGHPLKYFPTSDEIRALLLDRLNFSHVTVSSMYQIFHNALFATTMQIDAFLTDVFDEFEEMDLYLSHYALVTAVLILKDPFLSCLAQKTNLTEGSKKVDCSEDTSKIEVLELGLRRYGHASCVLDSLGELFFVTGGFGLSNSNYSSDGTHRRLADCLVVTLDDKSIQLETKSIESNSIDGVCLDRMHGQVRCIGFSGDDRLLFLNGGRQSPIEHNQTNVSFISRLDGSRQLRLEHSFNQDPSVVCWRHKLSDIHDGDRIYQVGGINLDSNQYNPLVEWRLESSRLGHFPLGSLDEDNLVHFRRHSFGMDMIENTILLLGGLRATDSRFRDRPAERPAVLYDLRTNGVSFPDLDCGQCYGTDLHFINEHQFVKMGGISTQTGLIEQLSTVELVDLRNNTTLDRFVLQEELTNQIMFTNATSCHLKASGEIYSLGGGGNFFTFGTYLNKHSFKYKRTL